ncbi:VCBS repeat-containing protein [Kangiella marina]|uniref:VCBS repeat-containing protein n=1 Tax=Kangiella marina TaxID=1079178 RepID=A0ABP8IMT7_9GAMM
MSQYKYTPYFLLLLTFSLSFVCKAQSVEIGNTTFSHSILNVGAGESTISAFDFNSDGHQDIVVSNYSDNNIVAYQGNGEGDLTEVGQYPAGDNPTDISVSDINGDGHLDVAITNHETSHVTLLHGDGKGNFKNSPYSPFNIDVKPHPHVAQLKDLDGDSIVDLVVDNRTHEGLSVFKGLGDGKFEKESQLIDVGGDPYLGFASGDINGNGKLDLVAPNQQEIAIALNTSTDKQSFSLKKPIPFESSFAVGLADMTGDGTIDLIVASTGNSMAIMPGDDQGNFLKDKKASFNVTSGAKQVATGDINGDGVDDALISNWSGEILVVLGSKDTFETVTFKHPNIPNPWGIVIVDLNEDGKSDFIVASGGSKLAAVYLSQDK